MKSKVLHHVNSIMLEAASAKRAKPHTPQFRCSSLPFCPLLNLLEDTRNESYSMDFYTTIGTAVHEIHQHWIPTTRYAPVVWGHWKCTCKPDGEKPYVHKGKKGAPITRPDKCKKCGADGSKLEYEEITVDYNGLSGHVDFITEIEPGKFVLWDWKTTDLGGKKRRYLGQWKKQYPSSKTYKVQINTYASLIGLLWDMNIVSTVLIFVDRGKAIASAADFYPYIQPWNKKRREKHMKFVDHACANNEILNKLNDEIAKSDGYSDRADKLLKQMVKARPCTNEDQYYSYMDKKFWGDQECRFKDACCSSSRKSYDAILSALNPNEEVPW